MRRNLSAISRDSVVGLLHADQLLNLVTKSENQGDDSEPFRPRGRKVRRRAQMISTSQFHIA
jgi:hypothetical protein